MATAVLFIGFDRPHLGKEEQAWSYLMTEAMAYLNKVEGQYFERKEIIGLTAHGGDMNGCIILFGERAKLDELRRTDEFEGFVMKLGSVLGRLGVVPGVNWDGMQAVMKRMQR